MSYNHLNLLSLLTATLVFNNSTQTMHLLRKTTPSKHHRIAPVRNKAYQSRAFHCCRISLNNSSNNFYYKLANSHNQDIISPYIKLLANAGEDVTFFTPPDSYSATDMQKLALLKKIAQENLCTSPLDLGYKKIITQIESLEYKNRHIIY